MINENPQKPAPSTESEPQGCARTWLHSLLGVEAQQLIWPGGTAPGRARVPAPPPAPLVAPHPPEFNGAARDSLTGALCALDPANDEHWTSQGLPRLDAVYAKHGREVTRIDINEAFPGFTRERARLGIEGAPSRPSAPPAPDEPEHHSLARAFRARLARVQKARAEHAALERAIGRPLPPPDFRCPLQRRISAENRIARYRQDRR